MLLAQEIEAVVPDATKKDIGKAYKTIMACLQAEEGVSNDVFVSLVLLSLKRTHRHMCSCHAAFQDKLCITCWLQKHTHKNLFE